MITEVTFEGFKTQDVPYRLEAGTPNVAGVIGLSAALEWLAETDIAQAEGVSVKAVCKSIAQALRSLEKDLKNFEE